MYKRQAINALDNSQCAVFMTYWKEFERINDKSINGMKRKLIIDCRRIFSKGRINAEYYALGIGK